jgi:hypothetical protein
MDFEKRLRDALNARTYPKDPEYGLDVIQQHDKMLGLIPCDSAHLLVLFNEYMMEQVLAMDFTPPDKYERLVIENLWHIRLRRLIAGVIGVDPHRLTEHVLVDYEVRKGWKLCKTR